MELEIVEDESGKWLYPRFMIVNTNGQEVAGPFDTESEAAQAAAEIQNALDSMS